MDILNKKIDETSKKIVAITNQLKDSYWAFIIAAVIFFLFRYIFYGIIWSIKTLKQP